MRKLVPLLPLLLSASLLLFANGLQSLLIAWRGSEEGFATLLIGAITATYYLGFVIGCVHITPLIRGIGHIRTFSAMASISTATIILCGLVVDPWMWMVLRLLNGYCLAIVFGVIESWLNAKVDNSIRARVLSVYRYADLGSNTLAQFFLPWFGGMGFVLFGISAIAFALSITPISLADRSSPAPPDKMRFNIKFLWQMSPLAATGCITVGFTTTVYRSLGPIYCLGLGFDTAQIAAFMSASIIAGSVLQYPLGYLSDTRGRRAAILVSTVGGFISSGLLFLLAGDSLWANMVGVFVLGAFSMPLYSLCSAHANDRAGPGQFAIISAGLLFFWAVGAVIGPLLASAVMGWLGANTLFAFTAITQAIFVAYTLMRVIQKPDLQRVP
jgi:MFS family permease